MKVDKEKLIRAMEYCTADITPVDENDECLGDVCPFKEGGYESGDCQENMIRAALALLREQEARVMDAEEVARLTEETYQWLWIEEIQNITWNLHCLRAFVYSKHPDTGEFYILANGYRDIVKLEGDEYGKTWRCWTSRPTEEQRKAVRWDETTEI